MTRSLTKHLDQIRATLPDSVRLIAVTKQVSVELMREAYMAGIRDFGESRIQEAEPKQAQLEDLSDITWHFLGHLQSNKAQKVLEKFTWIHSVDTLKLAQRLNRLAGEFSAQPQICLQVKILKDPNKFGWTIPELWQDLPVLDQCENLEIKGLMAIPPLGLEESEILDLFQKTREVADQINQRNWSRLQIRELSMGMSDDYLLGVQAGATMVRLGRILFGDRTQ